MGRAFRPFWALACAASVFVLLVMLFRGDIVKYPLQALLTTLVAMATGFLMLKAP